MPNILIEGPDGAGKTTLTEMLRQRIKRRYFVMVRHSCRPYTEEDVLRFCRLMFAIPPSLTAIIDRHPLISEPIYGPILRGKDLIANIGVKARYQMIRDQASAIVYCRPGLGTIKERLKDQPQLAGVDAKITDLVAEYDHVMLELERFGIPVYYYDWTRPDSFDTLAKKLFGDSYAA